MRYRNARMCRAILPCVCQKFLFLRGIVAYSFVFPRTRTCNNTPEYCIILISPPSSHPSPLLVCDRRMPECAKCAPIDSDSLDIRKRIAHPLPTPVTRQKVALDREFLAVDPPDGSHEQPVPLDSDPTVGEDTKKSGNGEGKASTPGAVVSEWDVLNTATRCTKQGGEAKARHARMFRECFAEVHARSGTRLRVDKSPVQVCLARRTGTHDGGGGGRGSWGKETAKTNCVVTHSIM